MNAPSRIVVTAAEFTRQFGHLRQALGEAPVFITHHGRETHVLLAKSRYDALRAADHRPRIGTGPGFGALAAVLPQGVLTIDAEQRVTSLNAAGAAMLGRAMDAVVGRNWTEALRDWASSPIAAHIRRALDSGEPAAADLPSPARADRWLRVEIRPDADAGLVLFHDITDDVRRHRLADPAQAAATALRRHSAIASVTVSVRGMIAAIDPAFATLVGLTDERLVGIAFADLIPLRSRTAFRETLNRVLRGNGPATATFDVLCNSGSAVTLSAELVELRGVYGSEGATIVMTRAVTGADEAD